MRTPSEVQLERVGEGERLSYFFTTMNLEINDMRISEFKKGWWGASQILLS